MIKKSQPLFEGVGSLRFLGHSGAARYCIEGDPTRLRLGGVRLRGSVSLAPDLAQEAFRAGEGVLTLDAGLELRLTMIGHTEGADQVFVELRV